MRGLFVVSGLAVVLSLAGGWSRTAAQDEKTYDLRGPAPMKGQVFRSKMTLKIKDADTTLKFPGQAKPIEVKVTMDIVGEEEQKVLAVDGRNVTKCQSKIIKDHSEMTMEFGGMSTPETISNDLEGEVIISERIEDGKWKHSLVDNKPTEKQKKGLDDRNGIENDDDLYPAEKVKVGHTWKVEAKALTKLFGNSFTDITGELKQKFLKIEDVGDEECAVIESTGTVKAKMKDDDGQPTQNVRMDLKVTSWRSIKSGVDLKEKFEGKIKLDGVQKGDDGKVEFTLSGPLSGESSTKIK